MKNNSGCMYERLASMIYEPRAVTFKASSVTVWSAWLIAPQQPSKLFIHPTRMCRNVCLQH